jgi:8-oxo-dGTP pyrophosphatase MutT (NUDIX family)
VSLVQELVRGELQRLLRDDGNNGKLFWTKNPEGLAKWADHPHPWTALYHHVKKFDGVTDEEAKRITSQWFHDVFGYLPGDRKGKNPVGPRSARIRAIVAHEMADLFSDEWDTDPVGELDDQTLALLDAMAELDDEANGSRAWDPAKHPRDPATGKFVDLVGRLKAAISLHQSGVSGKTHPLDGFSRVQLMKAAKLRGIKLKRGEDRDSIAAKLLADLNKPSNGASIPAAATGSPAVTVKPGPAWGNGSTTASVDMNGNPAGIVVHDQKTGGYFPFTNSNTQKSALGHNVKIKPGVNGGYKTQQDAVNAIVQAHTPTKVSGPGLAGLKLTELPIEPVGQRWSSTYKAKSSFEISQNGSAIGVVSDWGYGWEATDGAGRTVSVAMGPSVGKSQFKSKSEALKALVGSMPNPPAQPGTAAPLVLPQGSPHGPEIQGALDILFGKDPKGHTMARQLSVYGALRRGHFDQLGPAEQSTLLGDLAHIASKSKGAQAVKAIDLIHRFTPPGTTSGQIPKQAIHLPSGVMAMQTRVADPKGTPGLLKMLPAKDRGSSGDGWTRTSSGGSGPWGKYGAAGLMLRHVSSDGTERFLMVQRGPAISDPGKWQFPGGAKEQKESFFEGATREVVEELGFQASDLDSARVHGTHTNEVQSVQVPGLKGGTVPWAYISVAATVDKQLMPDLSTPHARAETSDAKWMTRAEIAKLDTGGKLLKPLAGGALEANVLTLFPGASAPPVGKKGQRPPRLTGTPAVTKPALPHKVSRAVDLVSDTATKNKLRQDVKKARKNYYGKSSDDRLAAIGAIQGFDDVPTVVSKSEMDRLLATGDYIEAWRGVKGAGASSGPTRGGQVTRTKTAAQIHEEFRSGPAYYGQGIYGNGFYFATVKSVAENYSDGTKGSVVRVLIPKTAKVIPHRQARAEASAASSAYSKAKGSTEEGTLYDEGRYAAAKGLDMIEIGSNTGGSSVAHPGKPAYAILNRSILIAEEA